MEFKWKEIDGDLILYGYYDSIIAKLIWNNNYSVWELQSDWLDCSCDIDIEITKENTDKVKFEAIDELKCACEEHIDWYSRQLEMLNELEKEGKL